MQKRPTIKVDGRLLNHRITIKNLKGINKLHVPKVHSTAYGLNSFWYDAPGI